MQRLALVLAFAGCATTGPDDDGATADELSLSPADAAAILAVVNYPGTTADTLTGIKLDKRAVTGILEKRNGADGVSPSPDDVAFTIASLDAVPYVADAAFTKLRAYAAAHPAPAGETVEGVAFAGWETEAVVWGVNHADPAVLGSLLDARAANGLVATRPFASVAAMGPVAYVAATALTKLRTNARAWWNAAHQPAGYVLTAAHLATVQQALHDGLSDDEGFATVVTNLAGSDDALANRIMTALATEIDRLTASYLNATFYDYDAARESLDNAAPVKQRTKLGGWTYLSSLGVTH